MDDSLAEAAATAFEARAAFLLRLRERGIRDLAVLRALEAISRSAFVAPHHAPFAFRDMFLPTEGGQSVPPPLLAARLLAGGRLAPEQRVLVVGTGAGYTTALLSRLVHHVVGVERLPSLVAAARERFAALGLDNITLYWADGLALPDGEVFDRIFLMGSIDLLPPSLWARLAPEGAILHARGNAGGIEDGASQVIVRVERQADGILRQVVLGPSRFMALRRGVVGRERAAEAEVG